MAQEQVYHFSLGNSSKGPIGFCARVRGKTREEAADRLKKVMDDLQELDLHQRYAVGEHVEYMTVYLNPEAVTARHATDPEPIVGAAV